MKVKIVLSFIIACLLSFTAFSQNKADDITGTWFTGGKEPAKIQVYKSGENTMVKLSGSKTKLKMGSQG
jgi:hypothetical protein